MEYICHIYGMMESITSEANYKNTSKLNRTPRLAKVHKW